MCCVLILVAIWLIALPVANSFITRTTAPGASPVPSQPGILALWVCLQLCIVTFARNALTWSRGEKRDCMFVQPTSVMHMDRLHFLEVKTNFNSVLNWKSASLTDAVQAVTYRQSLHQARILAPIHDESVISLSQILSDIIRAKRACWLWCERVVVQQMHTLVLAGCLYNAKFAETEGYVSREIIATSHT